MKTNSEGNSKESFWSELDVSDDEFESLIGINKKTNNKESDGTLSVEVQGDGSNIVQGDCYSSNIADGENEVFVPEGGVKADHIEVYERSPINNSTRKDSIEEKLPVINLNSSIKTNNVKDGVRTEVSDIVQDLGIEESKHEEEEAEIVNLDGRGLEESMFNLENDQKTCKIDFGYIEEFKGVELHKETNVPSESILSSDNMGFMWSDEEDEDVFRQNESYIPSPSISTQNVIFDEMEESEAFYQPTHNLPINLQETEELYNKVAEDPMDDEATVEPDTYVSVENDFKKEDGIFHEECESSRDLVFGIEKLNIQELREDAEDTSRLNYGELTDAYTHHLEATVPHNEDASEHVTTEAKHMPSFIPNVPFIDEDIFSEEEDDFFSTPASIEKILTADKICEVRNQEEYEHAATLDYAQVSELHAKESNFDEELIQEKSAEECGLYMEDTMDESIAYHEEMAYEAIVAEDANGDAFYGAAEEMENYEVLYHQSGAMSPYTRERIEEVAHDIEVEIEDVEVGLEAFEEAGLLTTEVNDAGDQTISNQISCNETTNLVDLHSNDSPVVRTSILKTRPDLQKIGGEAPQYIKSESKFSPLAIIRKHLRWLRIVR